MWLNAKLTRRTPTRKNFVCRCRNRLAGSRNRSGSYERRTSDCRKKSMRTYSDRKMIKTRRSQFETIRTSLLHLPRSPRWSRANSTRTNPNPHSPLSVKTSISNSPYAHKRNRTVLETPTFDPIFSKCNKSNFSMRPAPKNCEPWSRCYNRRWRKSIGRSTYRRTSN